MSIRELLEMGSLGTPEAKAIRASVSREQVAWILARVRELEAAEVWPITVWENEGGALL